MATTLQRISSLSRNLAFAMRNRGSLPRRTLQNARLTQSLLPRRSMCSDLTPKPEKETVSATFIKADGERITARGNIGDSLLDIVIDNDIDIDGYGACEGTLACSTCHVILKQADYDRLPEKPTDEELDMLDLAYSLSDTSRLGCQVILTKDLDGLTVQVPEGIADAREVD